MKHILRALSSKSVSWKQWHTSLPVNKLKFRKQLDTSILQVRGKVLGMYMFQIQKIRSKLQSTSRTNQSVKGDKGVSTQGGSSERPMGL